MQISIWDTSNLKLIFKHLLGNVLGFINDVPQQTFSCRLHVTLERIALPVRTVTNLVGVLQRRIHVL